VLLNFRFSEPDHWLRYFPPVATRDLQSMGVKVRSIRLVCNDRLCIYMVVGYGSMHVMNI
jgi:hypothetical protein